MLGPMSSLFMLLMLLYVHVSRFVVVVVVATAKRILLALSASSMSARSSGHVYAYSSYKNIAHQIIEAALDKILLCACIST